MRLIDCNEALRKVEQIPFIANENKAFHEGCRYMQKKVLRIFHESKSVDAKSVRHGHWVDGFDADGVLVDYDCSVCNMANDEKTDYCPYCGAKMDEVNE